MGDSSYPNPEWRYWWGTFDLVIAGYGGESEQFRAQLQTLLSRTGSLTKHSWEQKGNWISAACKTYDPTRLNKIDNRLMGLAGFCLRIKLKSTIAWTLVAFSNGQECLTYHHDFSLLHPRQLEPAYIATLSKAYEGQFEAYLEDYELNLPSELQAQWRSLPFREAHLHCMSWYQQNCTEAADRLFDLFQQQGVNCDRQELVNILTGKLCTPKELEWYVGNLPRFLTAIGLSDVFWNWQKELIEMNAKEEDH